MRATGTPSWIVAITVSTAPVDRVERSRPPPTTASGSGCSRSVTSVITPSVPFGADEQARQVVAGGRLARARPGRDDPAVGQHHRQAEHVLAHRAVAHGGRARRARRRHAADRRVGAGIDREHQAGVAQRLVQLHARHAGFDRRVEILGADAQRRGSSRAGRWRCRRASACTCPSSDVPAPNGTTGSWKRALIRDDRRRPRRWSCGKQTTSGAAGAWYDSPWL